MIGKKVIAPWMDRTEITLPLGIGLWLCDEVRVPFAQHPRYYVSIFRRNWRSKTHQAGGSSSNKYSAFLKAIWAVLRKTKRRFICR